MLVILAFFIALAILTPLLGADTRDGLDWTPGHFWLRRRPRDRRPTAKDDLRTTGSPARASAAPCAADHRRTAPAAG
jgi:hypothetical protein